MQTISTFFEKYITVLHYHWVNS